MWHLFFDCETGGLNSETDSLLTVFFAVCDSDLNIIDELDLQLKPEDLADLKVHESALKVTGIDMEAHLADPKTITYSEGKKKLLEFLSRNKIPRKRRHFRPAGHNLQFDLDFIFAQLIPEEEWTKLVHYNFLDTMRVTTFLQDIGLLPPDLGRLTSLVEYFDLPMREAHNAREDIKMTIDVYKALSSFVKGNVDSGDRSGNNSLLQIVEKR